MTIYFAGNTATEIRDKLLVEYGGNRLFSFHYHCEEGHHFHDWERYLKEVNKREDRQICSSPSAYSI